MAIAAESAADRVEQLISLTERVTALLAQDTADFEAHRPHEAASRAVESGRLANLYRHESTRVRRDPGLLADAPLERRVHLTRATEAMELVLKRHARALEAAKIITEGIVRAVAEEASTRRVPASGYGPSARANNADATPIALNRKA
jgi:hypothetical protein